MLICPAGFGDDMSKSNKDSYLTTRVDVEVKDAFERKAMQEIGSISDALRLLICSYVKGDLSIIVDEKVVVNEH